MSQRVCKYQCCELQWLPSNAHLLYRFMLLFSGGDSWGEEETG